MKVYLTQDTKKTIRNRFYKFIDDDMMVIDVDSIAESMDLKEYKNNEYEYWMIFKCVEKKIFNAYYSKRYNSILYITPNIDREVIYEFRTFLKDNGIFVTDFILIDIGQTLNQKIYKFFDNVM